ncbi:MAG: hypothetical protein ACI9XK_004940 [Granulosicoccus sp.]|jgi:hypothetical protein
MGVDIVPMALSALRAVRFLNYFSASLLAGILLVASTDAHTAASLFKNKDKNGVVTFSDAPMVRGQVVRTSYLTFVRKPTGSNPCRGMSFSQLDAKGRALNGDFKKVAQKFSVDPALLKAVARAESCFDPKAVSSAGATGLMQLMPTTARAMGVNNILDPQQNLLGGAQYLAKMLARYSSNTNLALAAYNAGPGNVDKYNGVPPFNETRRYIKAVTKFHQDYTPQFQQ